MSPRKRELTPEERAEEIYQEEDQRARTALLVAMERYVDRPAAGPLSEHTNLVIDGDTSAVVKALKSVPSLHMDKSKAMRYIIDRGIRAMLDDEREAA